MGGRVSEWMGWAGEIGNEPIHTHLSPHSFSHIDMETTLESS